MKVGSWPADALTALGLAVIGAAIRWPHLQRIPRFTDETEDTQFALEIAREGLRPLVSNDTYNGPIFHYILAAGFGAGAGPTWPRLVSLVFGALTVALCYFLGRSVALLADGSASPRRVRVAGLTASALMATAFVPVVVSSHIAWSNSTTAFWTTAYLLGLAEAVRRDRPALLVAAAVMGGVALQTHPSALALLVGGAAWLALTRRAWLQTRWPWVAATVAVACVANMIWFNVTTPGGSLELAEEREYAFTGGSTPEEYRKNAAGFLRLAYQMVGSSFVATIDETTDPDLLRATLTQPLTVVAGLVAAAGIGYATRRAGLGLAVWLAAVVILPFFNQAYHHYILARYLAPLLPPTFASVGALVALWATSSRRWLAAGTAAVALTIIVFPLGRIQTFYAGQSAEGKTNDRLWQLLDAMERESAHAPIYIDRELRHIRFTAGGNLVNVPDGMLDAMAVPHDVLRDREQPDLEEGAVILLSDGQRDVLADLFVLEPVPLAGTPAPASPDQHGLFRVVKRLGDG